MLIGPAINEILSTNHLLVRLKACSDFDQCLRKCLTLNSVYMKAWGLRLQEIFLMTKASKIAFIGAMALVMACGNDKKAEVEDDTEGTADVASVNEDNRTVNDFVQFIKSDDNKMTLDHSYTNEALKKLIDATEAMAKEVNYDVKADMDQAKQYAEQITEDRFETTHADNIRKSADIISGSLMKMQQEKFPQLSGESQELKNACASIDPKVLTLDQRDAVKNFFNEASEMLEKMN